MMIGIAVVVLVLAGAVSYTAINHIQPANGNGGVVVPHRNRTINSTLIPNTTNSSHGSYGSAQGSSIAPKATVTLQQGTFGKVYVGQTLIVGNVTINVLGIEQNSSTAVLNITTSSGALSDELLQALQYISLGSKGGSPYLLASSVALSSSQGNQNWVNLSVSPTVPQGFSQSQSPSSRQLGSNNTSYHGNQSIGEGTVVNELRDPQLQACGTNKAFFNTTPLSTANFTTFAPLGWSSPGGHVLPSNHGGFYIRQLSGSGSDVTPANVPVVSPGNVTVFEIIGQQYLNANHPQDYAIYIAPCANITFYLGHVQELSEKLSAAYTAPFVNCQNSTADSIEIRTCQKMMNVTFTAGEQIGNIGGQPAGTGGVEALDLGVYDYTLQPAGFANQSRYDAQQLHAACPLNYFTSSIQSYLYDNRIGVQGTIRNEQPPCGSFMQDVPGTAIGNWFQKGTPTPYTNEGSLISLIHDDFQSGQELFSIGLQSNITGLAGVTYYFSTQSTGNVNREFGNVTADGQIYCYDSFKDSYSGGNSVPGTILLQLTNANSLRIEYQNSGSCGSGPWSFGSQYSDFYR